MYLTLFLSLDLSLNVSLNFHNNPIRQAGAVINPYFPDEEREAQRTKPLAQDYSLYN